MLQVSIDAVALGGRTIVRDVEFTARSGEITGIIGPNGSGKSTLLKALSGDIAFDGSVRVNDRNIRELKAWQAASLRAVLPQQSNLAFPFTVREVVALGLTGGRAGVELAELDRLPEQALERVDLQGFAGRFYQDLSGGEQQRVQLARVLCQVWRPTLDGAPRYLFLDEPVSSLDVKHQLLVMRIAREFAEAGGGVLAILHDLNLAAMFADSLVVMQGGGMVDFGPTEAILTDERMSAVYDCAVSFHRDDTGMYVRLA